MHVLRKYYTELTALLIFLIYLFTLAPSVIQIDAGELATVQTTLGIAHPTGYPLFSMIGYLFLKIPFPFSKIYQANLLATVWCSLGIYIFIKMAELLLSKHSNSLTQSPKTKDQKQKKVFHFNSDQRIIAIISGTLFLGLSKTYWMQSTSVEVYSLQIFLFMLILFTSLKAYYAEARNSFDWIWVGLSYALGFSNHMTTMLVIPFSTILFFQKERFVKQSFLKIAITVATALPVLIIFYLYLPLRAAMNPTINWGNPVNIENILRHISGKQYQVWLFASVEAAEKQFKYFLTNFPSEFAYAGLAIGIIGFISLLKLNKKLFAAVSITFLTAVLYSINYDIVDIDSYFLLAYILFSFFIIFGFLKTITYLKEKSLKDIYTYSVIGILCFIPLAVNNSEVNQSDVHTYEDYTKAILNSSEKNSIVFSYQWDYFISPSYYFQNVEGFRKDVTVIDKELLRRSWYYNQLNTSHPDIINKLGPEIKPFLESLKPFEQDNNFDPNLIEKNYRTLMTSLVAKNVADRSIYIGLELFQNEMQRGEFTLPEGYNLVPYLLTFKVEKGLNYIPAPDPDFIIRLPREKNKYIQFIENTIGTMLTYRAAYELQFGKKERARIYLNKVLKEFKDYQIPFNILNAAGY